MTKFCMKSMLSFTFYVSTCHSNCFDANNERAYEIFNVDVSDDDIVVWDVCALIRCDKASA